MKFTSVLAASMAVVILGTTAASAATLTNRDVQSFKLRIIEGEQEREMTIEPQQVVDGVCNSLCSIMLGDDPDPYEVALNEKLSIEDGQLFVEDDESANTDQELEEQKQ